MRIIAKNHDYYDSALAFGHDPNVVFERREEKFTDYHARREDQKWPDGYHFMNPRLSTSGGYRNEVKTKHGYGVSIFPFTVAFCGKLYPGIRVHVSKPYPKKDKDYFSYDFATYAKVMKRLGVEFVEPKYNHNWTLSQRGVGSPRKEKDCEEYFERSGEDHVVFFAERRKPIVVWDTSTEIGWHGPTLHFNPELRAWEFFKVFDPYTAFQELDMFISGVMTHPSSHPSKVKPKRPNPVDISDEDLRDKKGFDDMSFKKSPTKKR